MPQYLQWQPRQPKATAATRKAFHAHSLVQHVAQNRQSTDVSIVPSLLLGVAALVLFLLPQLAPEQATWMVGPRPHTGLLQPAVLLLERLLFLRRPRLENDEMCGLTTGGQVSLPLLCLPDGVASRFCKNDS